MTMNGSDKTFSILFVALLLGNLAIGIYYPLTADEAHYALYGLHLDWSYFDHPPMVGWLQAITLNFGDSDWILRIISIALGLAIFTLLFQLTKKWFDNQIALLTILLFFFSPLLKLLTLMMLPELPLVFAGLATFYFCRQLSIKDNWFNYTGLGLALGLAALSKYTAITLVISVAGTLLMTRSARILVNPGIWWSALIASILITPIIYWNWQNDWLSFNYQINHGTGRSGLNWSNAIQMQAAQLIAFGPLVYLTALIAIFRPVKRHNETTRTLLWFALPILILFSFTALKGRNLPHWTLLGVVFTLPLVAHEIHARWNQRIFKWYFGITASLTLIIWLVVHSILAGVNPGFRDFQHPLQDLIGWDEIAQETNDQASDDIIKTIAIPNWSNASRIAWYARPLPVKVLDQRFDQFDLWFGSMALMENAWLILDFQHGRFELEQLQRFEQCELKINRQFHSSGVVANEFNVYRCTNFLG